MFPWNWFDHNLPLDEKALQKLLEQWTKQMWPYKMMDNYGNPDKKDQRAKEKPSLHEEVFETHDYIFIRIPIRDPKAVKHIKVQFSHTKCTITGLMDEVYEILLPKPVQKKGARAVYRDHILEIQLVRSFDWHLSEIAIDEL